MVIMSQRPDSGLLRRYAEYSTLDLRDHREHVKERRVQTLDQLGDMSEAFWNSSLDFDEALISDLSQVIEYRDHVARKYQGDPLSPPLMKSNPELMELALDLKRIWPIDIFCAEMMAMNLDRTGSRFRSRCPLGTHADSSPSFVLYPSENRFYCFGCRAHGDIFDLTMNYFNIHTFAEAVHKIADGTATFGKVAS